jgi:CheY-like chemotaxis protein
VSRTILVIDDDEGVRALLVHNLAAWGYEVAEAADGPGGLAELERRSFDLVLVDYAMPLMNGADVVQRIREKSPGQTLLLVSGYADTGVVRSAVADIAILAKPFRQDELQRAVEKALAGG